MNLVMGWRLVFPSLPPSPYTEAHAHSAKQRSFSYFVPPSQYYFLCSCSIIFFLI